MARAVSYTHLEEAGHRSGLEQPRRTGVQVNGHRVQSGGGLVIAFQRQRYVHQPGGLGLAEPGSQQLPGQPRRQHAVHRRGLARAHAVAQHLSLIHI